MNYIIATIKPWNIRKAKEFIKKMKKHKGFLFETPAQLTFEKIKKINPRYIFFPHWSWIIPEVIYNNFECVVFHMTDLPYGRGGSPLQNLIVRGLKKTKMSAIRVVKALDAGPIYLKRPLSLEGKAQEIYERSTKIVFDDMIPYILRRDPQPLPQKGKAVIFKRRKPEESSMTGLKNLKDVYNHIRMLDADTYPKAFMETSRLKMEFTNAKLKNNYLSANVKIEVKK